jgi:hypothetical protein
VKCPRCGDEFVEQQIDVCLCSADPPSKITGVLAFVCATCGEREFSPEVARALEATKARLGEKPDAVQSLYVYEFVRDRVAPDGAGRRPD